MRTVRPAAKPDRRRFAAVILLAALLPGCALVTPQTAALRESRPAELPERVELAAVPFFAQKDYQCGPAALAMTLSHLGLAAKPEDLAAQVYLPARQGSLQVEMLAAPRRYGLVSYQLAPSFADLLREVAAGNPVVVLQDYGVWPASIWHYAVVAGYDLPQEQVVLRSGEKPRLVMPFGVFEYLWKESKYWAMVSLPPGRIPASAGESRYLAAITALEGQGGAPALKTAYAAFLERWPDNLAAGIGLANAHYAAGELLEAEAVLRRTAERHPDSPVALNNLAQTLSDLGRQAEALQVIEQAAALKGEFAASVDQTRELILKRKQGVTAAKRRQG